MRKKAILLITILIVTGCTPETRLVPVPQLRDRPARPAVLFEICQEPTPPIAPSEWTPETIESYDIAENDYWADYKLCSRTLCNKLRRLAILEGHTPGDCPDIKTQEQQ